MRSIGVLAAAIVAINAAQAQPLSPQVRKFVVYDQPARLTGQLCSVDDRKAAALGVDDLEHGPVCTIDSPQVKGLIADLVQRKVAITSTLPVFEAMVAARPLLSKKTARDVSGRVRGMVGTR